MSTQQNQELTDDGRPASTLPEIHFLGRGLRIHSLSTRLSAEEIERVSAVVKPTGKSESEWLRDLVLKALEPRMPDPVMAELKGLNVFIVTALVHLLSSKEPMHPETLQNLIDTAKRTKQEALNG